MTEEITPQHHEHHEHAPGCNHGEPHNHPHGEGHAHSTKAGWIFAAVAAVTIGAFFFDRYRKKKEEKEANATTNEEVAKQDIATVAHSKMPPAEREEKKTADDKAEDIAYTVNHSLACLTSDFVTNPLISTVIQKTLNKHTHTHHDHGIFGHTVVGEIAGDLLAVAPTIAVQRFFPSFMDSLRRMMEPVLGGVFRKGAERTSHQWAVENKVDITSDDYKNHVEAVYQHEISHLPQALMWSASSMAINIASQKLSGNKNPVWQIAAGTAGGIATTAALVVGARAIVPDTARDWDRFTSKRLLLPVTKAVDMVLGINHDTAVIGR